MSYIVEFPNGGNPYWLAPWTGDPGRTVVRENAQAFPSETLAGVALTLAQKNYGNEPNRKALKNGVIRPK